MLHKPLLGAIGLALTVPAASLMLPVAPAVAAADQADLAKVSAYIRAVKTLKANFTQTDRSGQTLSGTLYLKQPGKIRFSYGDSVPLLIVSDGKALTMIDYEVNQVQRWPIGNSPLAVLLDPSKDPSKFGKVVDSGDPRILSVEARDPKHPEYGVITLIFERDPSGPAGLNLYGWVALDAQNNRTTVRLTSHEYGVSIPDSQFRYRDPRSSGRHGR